MKLSDKIDEIKMYVSFAILDISIITMISSGKDVTVILFLLAWGVFLFVNRKFIRDYWIEQTIDMKYKEKLKINLIFVSNIILSFMIGKLI